MKQEKVKMAYRIVTILLVLMMFGLLVVMTVGNREEEDVPAMAEGEETESAEVTEAESETETEAEASEPETEIEMVPEPEVKASEGLIFVSNGNGTLFTMRKCRDTPTVYADVKLRTTGISHRNLFLRVKKNRSIKERMGANWCNKDTVKVR